VEYDEKVCYNPNNTEIFHVDTDILEIIANTTTTQSMARSPSTGGDTSFIPQEEWLKLAPHYVWNCWPSNARNLWSSKDLTSLATFVIKVLTFMIHRRWLIWMISLSHVVHSDDHGTDEHTGECTDTLLAHMAGRVSAGTSPGDI
jgi:hypothetical protein